MTKRCICTLIAMLLHTILQKFATLATLKTCIFRMTRDGFLAFNDTRSTTSIQTTWGNPHIMHRVANLVYTIIHNIDVKFTKRVCMQRCTRPGIHCNVPLTGNIFLHTILNNRKGHTLAITNHMNTFSTPIDTGLNLGKESHAKNCRYTFLKH